tara:strand:+ start:2154 stop:2495 length:342 start_codon:yes stop_codon:yes gene_type:complete
MNRWNVHNYLREKQQYVACYLLYFSFDTSFDTSFVVASIYTRLCAGSKLGMLLLAMPLHWLSLQLRPLPSLEVVEEVRLRGFIKKHLRPLCKSLDFFSSIAVRESRTELSYNF